MRCVLALLGAVLCLAQTPAATAKKSAFDKPTLEAYLRHLNLWPAQVQVQVSDPVPSKVPGFKDVTVRASLGPQFIEGTYLVSNDGQKILRAEIYDIALNPFADENARIKNEFQPSLGTPGAPVVVTVFSDFQCAFCKEMGKSLHDNLVKAYPTNVRMYFRDFPLEQIHPWAKPASIAGRCVFRAQPAAFWDYHNWIFDKQAEITPENLKNKVLEWAATKQLDALQLTRCLDNKQTESEVDKNIAEGKLLNVNSTPTVFVNGRRIAGNVPWANLKAIIDYELDYQKTAKNAGEQACCSLELKTPLTPNQ